MEGWTRGPIIGRGSTATVSLAVESSGGLIAVKSIELSSSAILQKERSLLSKLSSPYIVKFLGSVSTYENNRFLYNILMEYVSGGTLYDLIKKHGGKLPESAIRSYTCQILKGLNYLHARGIVHCDVKSQNVLIGENGVLAKIADLGCAKTVEQSGATLDFSGTPAFMAPEVARGEEQGLAADVWALGCTVIEMATGLSPWPELNDIVTAMYKIGFAGESPEIPGWLSEKAKDFLRNCLRRDLKERLTVQELLQHPFLEEQDESLNCLKMMSSPSTVLDQDFWDSFETSKNLLIQTEHEDPFADYSKSFDSLTDRIKKLAGDAFSGKPNWDSDDGEWIRVRSNEIGENRKSNEEVNENGVEETSPETMAGVEETSPETMAGVEETSPETMEGVESLILEGDGILFDYYYLSESDDVSYLSTTVEYVIPLDCYNIQCNFVSSIINSYENDNNINNINHNIVLLHTRISNYSYYDSKIYVTTNLLIFSILKGV